MATAKLKRALGFRDLFLFYVASGLSLRWIATAAASGPSAIVVWLTALLGFFVPLAACVLDLSSRYPAEGGLYIWTREAFGPFSAFISAWTYWMSNLPYFPSVLFFAASSLLFLGGPMQQLGGVANLFSGIHGSDAGAYYGAECCGIGHGEMAQQCWRARRHDSCRGFDCAGMLFVHALRVCNTFCIQRDDPAAGDEEPDFPVDDLLRIWRLRGRVVHGG